jgi:DNA-binding NarL/FixJ family response regulator
MAGHEVVTARDGHGAVGAATAANFDLMITDLIMPDKEGIETIIELRKKHPSLKIIAMSGGGRGSAADYLEIATQVGAAGTLSKPFSTQTFLDAVNKALAI